MGKFLRVLVIFMFLLAVGTLVLGCLLFARRELLKGRTQTMEEHLIEIAAYIEAQPGAWEQKPEDPSRDTSPCEAEVLDSPDRSEFWDSYKYDLEIAEPVAMVDLNARRDDMMRYYLRDRFTGQVIPDAQGYPQTKGSTNNPTMYNVLEDFKATVIAQLDKLNETREQLRVLRDEYIVTINELNERKAFLRERLVEIVQLKAKIAELEQTIRDLEEKIAELEQTIRDLEQQIADLRREILRLEEEIRDRDDKIIDLQTTVSNLMNRLKGKDIAGIDLEVTAGAKGKVIESDEYWGFVAAELTDKCMMELLGEDLDRATDPIGFEMYIERRYDDRKPAFVTKITLRHINRQDKTAIFDIVPGWTQIPIHKGDTIYRYKLQDRIY